MKKQSIYKTVSITGAFIIWGLWAYYINHGSFISRLTSAICQGLLSSLATALMISSLKALLKSFNEIFLPAIIVTSSTALTGSLIHYSIGTSEIVATLSPAVTVAFIFSLITSYNIKTNSLREAV